MIKNTLAEIIFKMFHTKESLMMTVIDKFKNILSWTIIFIDSLL